MEHSYTILAFVALNAILLLLTVGASRSSNPKSPFSDNSLKPLSGSNPSTDFSQPLAEMKTE